jgi:hypothetical protein
MRIQRVAKTMRPMIRSIVWHEETKVGKKGEKYDYYPTLSYFPSRTFHENL